MLINGFGKYQNVINVNNCEVLMFIENVIHDLLKFQMGILKTE